MRALVVLAHPCADSYNHALAQRAIAGLRAGGHQVDLLDLYAVGFRAAMSSEERDAYHGEQPVLDPQVAEHIDLVRAAEALVFVYPTWWSGPPAILKGWLERIMVPGVGFVFDASGKVKPGLGQVRRIVGISTYGASRMRVLAVNDNGRRILTRALRLSCGFRARPMWIPLYAMDDTTPAERTDHLDLVEQKLGSL